MNKKIFFSCFVVVLFLGFLVSLNDSDSAQSCQIKNVSWSSGNHVFGSIVQIITTGTDCLNWGISIQVWEDDTFGDDFVKSISDKFGGNGTVSRVNWRIGDGNKPDETSGTYQFYVIAIAGSSQVRSNYLNIPVPSGGGTWSGGTGGGPCTGTGGEPIPCPGQTTSVSFEIPNPIQATSLIDLAKAIGKFLLQIAIPIAVIVIIYAGVLFLTSGGKPEQVKKARTALLYAVVGLAIILIGQGFFVLIKSILDLGGPSAP